MSNPDRDRGGAFDRALGDALSGGDRRPAAGDPCLDVETLAAWLDDGLDAHARAGAERHVADCARCQALLAAIARTAPVEERGPASWRVHSVMWLVPLAAAALVVLVVLPVIQPRKREVSGSAPTAHAENRTVPPPVAQPPASSAFADEKKTATDAVMKRNAHDTPRTQAAAAENQKQLDALAARAEPKSKTAAPAAKDERADAAAAAASPPPAPPAPAPVGAPAPPPAAPVGAAAPQKPAAEAAQTANAASAAGAMRQLQQSADAAKASPSQAAQTAQSRLRDADRFALAMRPSTAAILVVSPNPAVRWMILPNGAVQRTVDSAATWQPQQTGVTSRLAAGSAPSPTVCWLVGELGVVLVTVDGTTWQRVPGPAPADLIAVRASDAKTATVETADHRLFSTADRGATWSVVAR